MRPSVLLSHWRWGAESTPRRESGHSSGARSAERKGDRVTGDGKTMELVPHRRLSLFSGRSHPELAREIATHLGVELGEANLRDFADGQIHCRYDTSIRGSDVFIIQTHAHPVNDSVMEQLIMMTPQSVLPPIGSPPSAPTTATRA